MRSTFVPIVLVMAAGSAAGQPALYSNGSVSPANPGLITGAVTASGVAAPPGALWSEVAGSGEESNMVAGFSGHSLGSGGDAGGAFRFADDFVVPPGGGSAGGWDVRRVALFVYRVGPQGPQLPFSAVTVRIWNGVPGAPGSQVVFGDTTTNRLAAAAPSNIYRVFNTAAAPAGTPDTSRRIWRLEADLGRVALAPGTYWLDWQVTSADPERAVFVPPVTHAGRRAEAGWNARQLRPGDAAGWTELVDQGKPMAAADLPQDLPFILMGDGGCAVDWNRDGAANSADVGAFLASWVRSLQEGTLAADFNGDGVVNSADNSEFLAAWLRGVNEGC